MYHSGIAEALNPDLWLASAVDKGAHRIVSPRSADIQLSAVPRLNQADEVCALLLETQRTKSN